MPIYKSIIETIGKTPIIELNNLDLHTGSKIYAKIEFFNPGSSIKDRPALNMIESAEKEGILKNGAEIVEATSGNTGIGLAVVCAVKGFKLTIFMPESVSIERQRILRALGANVILTPIDEGMKGSIKRAEKHAEKNAFVFLTRQFVNKANPDAHRKTTALEILDDLPDLDVFISTVGTGGTLTGVGEILKKNLPNIRIIAVEPENSPVLSGGSPGKHDLEGMGAGFIPDILNTDIIDDVITISKEEAYKCSKLLAEKEGILAGKSSGASLAAALQYLRQATKVEKILIILPDTGERYLSTDLWIEKKADKI